MKEHLHATLPDFLAQANPLMNLRNRATLFWNFAFPIGLILLYGVIWQPQIAWLAVGIVALNLMSSGLLGDLDRGLPVRTAVYSGVCMPLRCQPGS